MAIYGKHIKELKINLKYFWFYRNILYRINYIWQYFGFISIYSIIQVGSYTK